MAAITIQLIPYGGVLGSTTESLVAEMLLAKQRGHDLTLMKTEGDSLLPRRRSIAMTVFFEQSADDVYVTVDHDVAWKPGDVISLAERALELDAVVGGLYSKRQEGQGWASRLAPNVGQFRIPSDRVIDAVYVGSGFMAVTRSALRKIVDAHEQTMLTRCWNGKTDYWDFYHTFSVPHLSRPEINEYLSEDWAFCYRARQAGVPILADLKPEIVHYGERGFKAVDGIPFVARQPQQQETQHGTG